MASSNSASPRPPPCCPPPTSCSPAGGSCRCSPRHRVVPLLLLPRRARPRRAWRFPPPSRRPLAPRGVVGIGGAICSRSCRRGRATARRRIGWVGVRGGGRRTPSRSSRGPRRRPRRPRRATPGSGTRGGRRGHAPRRWRASSTSCPRSPPPWTRRRSGETTITSRSWPASPRRRRPRPPPPPTPGGTPARRGTRPAPRGRVRRRPPRARG